VVNKEKSYLVVQIFIRTSNDAKHVPNSNNPTFIRYTLSDLKSFITSKMTPTIYKIIKHF